MDQSAFRQRIISALAQQAKSLNHRYKNNNQKNTMAKILILFLAIWAACAALTVKLSQEKKLGSRWWGFSGILFGPFALLATMRASSERVQQGNQSLSQSSPNTKKMSRGNSQERVSRYEATGEPESWMKTALDRIFGPIRFF